MPGIHPIANRHKQAICGQTPTALPAKISGWATNNGSNLKALKYTPDGKVDTTFLNAVIEQVMFTNGVKMVARFLKNWPDDWQESGVYGRFQGF